MYGKGKVMKYDKLKGVLDKSTSRIGKSCWAHKGDQWAIRTGTGAASSADTYPGARYLGPRHSKKLGRSFLK